MQKARAPNASVVERSMEYDPWLPVTELYRPVAARRIGRPDCRSVQECKGGRYVQSLKRPFVGRGTVDRGYGKVTEAQVDRKLAAMLG